MSTSVSYIGTHRLQSHVDINISKMSIKDRSPALPLPGTYPHDILIKHNIEDNQRIKVFTPTLHITMY